MCREYLLLILICSLFLPAVSCQTASIPSQIGGWRVEVGPPGNDFYQAPPPPEEVPPPPDVALRTARQIAPKHTEIRRWELQNQRRYFIRAESGPEEYDFLFTLEGDLIELAYEDDLANVAEDPGELILVGTRKAVTADEIPSPALEAVLSLYPEESSIEYWRSETHAGPRYIITTAERAFYSRPDGQIQAVGLLEDGALDEVEPEEPKSLEDIKAEAVQQLGSYQAKFNFASQIEKLGDSPDSRDGAYRFIVIGDSRSNPDLWFNIVQHIDQLVPKADFVINTGDIVPHGYTSEYMEYYIPPLVKTSIPFFVAIGNHDDGDEGNALEYQTLFGENSLNYYFDYGNRRFIMVDNVTTVRPYEETLAWLEQVLVETPPGYSTLVAAHKPVANVEKWAYHSWDPENSQVFANLMTKYDVDHVFFGHIHAYSTAEFEGISYTICGGGGAGLHDRFGPQGNVHHYLICDVLPDGSIKQQVVRFYRQEETPS